MHELFTFRPGTFNQSHPMNRAVSYTIDLVYKVPAGMVIFLCVAPDTVRAEAKLLMTAP